MAEILPFKGIRYNVEAVSPDDVTSPPYDVISPADLKYLLARHPKNAVRLILGQELPEDNEKENRYTRSAGYFSEWTSDGTLLRDEKPVLYAYEQSFGSGKTVRGFTTLVKLHSFDECIVLPHEYTLARPKSHLGQLIRSTNANLDSVYGLYPDPDHAADAILERISETTPVEEATDRQGVRFRLWIVSDKSDIDAITQVLTDRAVVIADGHHRYETSLAYRDEMREKTGISDGTQPFDYVMMTLVNLYTPDLVVLPTHRMVKNLPEELIDGLESRLSDQFIVAPSDRGSIITDMASRGNAIGVYSRGRAFTATPKGSAEASDLDVFVLHRDILQNILGIDSISLSKGLNVSYTRDEKEAIAAVDAGEIQIAFFLNPISLEAMLEAARAGRRMPQKATYFYPKLLSGLVMRRIEW